VSRSQPKAFFISIQKTKPLPKYNTKIINNQPTEKSSKSKKVSQTTKNQGDRLLEKKLAIKLIALTFLPSLKYCIFVKICYITLQTVAITTLSLWSFTYVRFQQS
jgi:hypothetical protein